MLGMCLCACAIVKEIKERDSCIRKRERGKEGKREREKEGKRERGKEGKREKKRE